MVQTLPITLGHVAVLSFDRLLQLRCIKVNPGDQSIPKSAPIDNDVVTSTFITLFM